MFKNLHIIDVLATLLVLLAAIGLLFKLPIDRDVAKVILFAGWCYYWFRWMI